MYKNFRGFLKNRKGATAIEYGLIAAAMAVIIIVAMNALGPDLQNAFDDVGASLTSATSGSLTAPTPQ